MDAAKSHPFQGHLLRNSPAFSRPRSRPRPFSGTGTGTKNRRKRCENPWQVTLKGLPTGGHPQGVPLQRFDFGQSGGHPMLVGAPLVGAPPEGTGGHPKGVPQQHFAFGRSGGHPILRAVLHVFAASTVICGDLERAGAQTPSGYPTIFCATGSQSLSRRQATTSRGARLVPGGIWSSGIAAIASRSL